MSFNFGDIEKKTVIFCFRLRQKKRRATKKNAYSYRENCCAPRIACCTARNQVRSGCCAKQLFWPNVAPAQQRSSATANKCPGLYVIINLHTSLCHKVLMRDRSYLDNEVADSAAIRFAEKLLIRWYSLKKKKNPSRTRLIICRSKIGNFGWIFGILWEFFWEFILFSTF